MVHHDDALGRLTEGAGALAAMTGGGYQARRHSRTTSDRIMTLGELCDLVAGRAALVIEMKSHFADDARLPARVAAVLQNYAGPVAVMSFDPRQVVALSKAAPGLPRGIVAEGRYDHPEWSALSGWQKYQLAHLLHGFRTRPHFVAYGVQGPAGDRAPGRALRVRAAAADLDGAQRGRPQAGAPLCQPDDL